MSEVDVPNHAEMTISSVNTSPSNLETVTNGDDVVTDDTANSAPSRERRRTAASTASAASSGTWMPPVTHKSRRPSKQQIESMNLRQKFSYNSSGERVTRQRSNESASTSSRSKTSVRASATAAVQSQSQGKMASSSGHSTPIGAVKKAAPSASPSAATTHEMEMGGYSDVTLPEVAGSSSETKTTRHRRSFIGQAWRSTRVEQLRQLNRKLNHRRTGDDRHAHVGTKLCVLCDSVKFSNCTMVSVSRREQQHQRRPSTQVHFRATASCSKRDT